MKGCVVLRARVDRRMPSSDVADGAGCRGRVPRDRCAVVFDRGWWLALLRLVGRKACRGTSAQVGFGGRLKRLSTLSTDGKLRSTLPLS